MCVDPASLAIGIGLLGGVVQGVGAYNTSMNNAASLTAQAEASERDAEINERTSAYEIARTRETVERTLGNQRAGFAANGVALSGSALDVMADTATEGDLDIAAIQWNSSIKSDSLKYESRLLKANAADAATAAPIAFLTPVINSAAKFGGQFG